MCASLPSISNGVITYSPEIMNPFEFGTNATYSCDEGFYLSDRPLRTCTGSGTTSFWDGQEPECLGLYIELMAQTACSGGSMM